MRNETREAAVASEEPKRPKGTGFPVPLVYESRGMRTPDGVGIWDEKRSVGSCRVFGTCRELLRPVGSPIREPRMRSGESPAGWATVVTRSRWVYTGEADELFCPIPPRNPNLSILGTNAPDSDAKRCSAGTNPGAGNSESPRPFAKDP